MPHIERRRRLPGAAEAPGELLIAWPRQARPAGLGSLPLDKMSYDAPAMTTIETARHYALQGQYHDSRLAQDAMSTAHAPIFRR